MQCDLEYKLFQEEYRQEQKKKAAEKKELRKQQKGKGSKKPYVPRETLSPAVSVSTSGAGGGGKGAGEDAVTAGAAPAPATAATPTTAASPRTSDQAPPSIAPNPVKFPTATVNHASGASLMPETSTLTSRAPQVLSTTSTPPTKDEATAGNMSTSRRLAEAARLPHLSIFEEYDEGVTSGLPVLTDSAAASLLAPPNTSPWPTIAGVTGGNASTSHHPALPARPAAACSINSVSEERLEWSSMRSKTARAFCADAASAIPTPAPARAPTAGTATVATAAATSGVSAPAVVLKKVEMAKPVAKKLAESNETIAETMKLSLSATTEKAESISTTRDAVAAPSIESKSTIGAGAESRAETRRAFRKRAILREGREAALAARPTNRDDNRASRTCFRATLSRAAKDSRRQARREGVLRAAVVTQAVAQTRAPVLAAMRSTACRLRVARKAIREDAFRWRAFLSAMQANKVS